MRRALPFILFAFFFTTAAPAQEIISVTPSVVNVGTNVTLTGGPFPEDTWIILGTTEVSPSAKGARSIVFSVPPLESGEYALMLRSSGRLIPSRFSLRVIEREPLIAAVSPANIDECSTAAERRIAISGEFFSPGAQLLLDGAGMPIESIQPSEIVFTAPPLKGGIHNLQVVNPGDRKSLPATLFVNSIPAILSAEQGADDVTSYELIIRGKNILFNSTLVVDGNPVNAALTTDSGYPLASPATPALSGDTVSYIDCNTLIYIRHPYSRQAKRVSLQIVNPGGNQSPVYYLTIP